MHCIGCCRRFTGGHCGIFLPVFIISRISRGVKYRLSQKPTVYPKEEMYRTWHGGSSQYTDTKTGEKVGLGGKNLFLFGDAAFH